MATDLTKEELEEKVFKLEAKLSNLYARIFRDGGHAEGKLGEAAFDEADKVVANLNAESDELKKWKTWGEDDKGDKFSGIIETYNPARGGPDARHDLMSLAMDLIAPRHSKFSIVFLLVALLADSEAFLKKAGIKK